MPLQSTWIGLNRLFFDWNLHGIILNHWLLHLLCLHLVTRVEVLLQELIVLQLIVVVCVVGLLESVHVSDQRLLDLAIVVLLSLLLLLLIVSDVPHHPSLVLLLQLSRVVDKPILLVVGPPFFRVWLNVLVIVKSDLVL